MDQQYIYFRELPINASFSFNGNKYRKQSTRTAKLLEYSRVFYFGQRDLCIVGRHNRLATGYFEKTTQINTIGA